MVEVSQVLEVQKVVEVEDALLIGQVDVTDIVEEVKRVSKKIGLELYL